MQISRPRRFEAAGRRAFGSGTRCPQRVYLFRPPCAPNFRYVRCASPDYQSRSRRAPPHAELQSACGAMRPHASSRRLQQTSTSVSDVDMVATKMPAPNEVHFRPCRQTVVSLLASLSAPWACFVFYSILYTNASAQGGGRRWGSPMDWEGHDAHSARTVPGVLHFCPALWCQCLRELWHSVPSPSQCQVHGRHSRSQCLPVSRSRKALQRTVSRLHKALQRQ